jgi:hypothetical protein
MDGTIAVDSVKGTYLNRQQMEDFFLEGWNILGGIVDKYADFFKPRHQKGNTLYLFNKSTEQLVEDALDKVYALDNEENPDATLALLNLKDIVGEARICVQKKKSIPQKFINLVDSTILYSTNKNQDVGTLEDCIFATHIRESAFASMNGHPITPLEYLKELEMALIAYPRANPLLKYNDVSVSGFIDDLYRSVAFDKKAHKSGSKN